MGTLTWGVATVAKRKGILTPADLAQESGLASQTVDGVWAGRRRGGVTELSKMVEVETLRRLCVALEARPPSVFRWINAEQQDQTLPWHLEVQDGPPWLAWRVRELAEERGMDRIAFGRAARMYFTRRPDSKPNMAERIWAGEHQFISLTTLVSICEALFPGEVARKVGDLFVYTPDS